MSKGELYSSWKEAAIVPVLKPEKHTFSINVISAYEPHRLCSKNYGTSIQQRSTWWTERSGISPEQVTRFRRGRLIVGDVRWRWVSCRNYEILLGVCNSITRNLNKLLHIFNISRTSRYSVSRILYVRKCPPKCWRILSDSQMTLSAMQYDHPYGLPLTTETAYLVSRMRFQWIPGHCRIRRYERADAGAAQPHQLNERQTIFAKYNAIPLLTTLLSPAVQF